MTFGSAVTLLTVLPHSYKCFFLLLLLLFLLLMFALLPFSYWCCTPFSFYSKLLSVCLPVPSLLLCMCVFNPLCTTSFLPLTMFFYPFQTCSSYPVLLIFLPSDISPSLYGLFFLSVDFLISFLCPFTLPNPQSIPSLLLLHSIPSCLFSVHSILHCS